jgi:DNA-nicking Smr family endonuclease
LLTRIFKVILFEYERRAHYTQCFTLAIALLPDPVVSKQDDDKTDDDSSLFRRSMGDTKPLRQDKLAPDYKPKPRPRASFSRQDEREALRESLDGDIEEIETGAGESLRFNRPSVGRQTMRKLARGNFSVRNEIDLHGMTVPEARNALREFISESCYRGHTCVRVIHGKGLGSGERGAVLKAKVNNWLRRFDEVLAFVSTRQVHGGTGAVYVLLRKD